MRESTATTTRRGPVKKAGAGPRTARRLAETDQDFATRGATALAPAHEGGAGDRRTAGRPRLRVAPPSPVTVPRAPFVALVLVVVVAGVLGILVLNTKINENAFRLANLHDQQSNLDEREQQLNQALINETSPNSLYADALRMGLVPAGTPAYIQMPNGKVVGVPQPATSTPSVTAQQSGTSGTGH